MKKIKLFAFIGMLTIAYVIGGIIGFAFCASTQKAEANTNKTTFTIPESNEMYIGSNVEHKRVYVNGRYYVVFCNTCGLSAVKEY